MVLEKVQKRAIKMSGDLPYYVGLKGLGTLFCFFKMKLYKIVNGINRAVFLSGSDI